MNLSRLLLFHAIITLAAGVVLIVAPQLIPGTVGIHLPHDAYLLCYLLAGSELGLAAMSFYGRSLNDVKALRVISLTCIVLHASSAILEVYAYTQGLSAAIWGNIVLRIVVVGLFIYYGFFKTANATKKP
ncbi:MAG: hypothetical protein JWQ38_2253 [Flavipsychrobacter sp.]|nr:hypothetical protein [Flavipsychrobacter sp.]